jgi:hypothetical protein
MANFSLQEISPEKLPTVTIIDIGAYGGEHYNAHG